MAMQQYIRRFLSVVKFTCIFSGWLKSINTGMSIKIMKLVPIANTINLYIISGTWTIIKEVVKRIVALIRQLNAIITLTLPHLFCSFSTNIFNICFAALHFIVFFIFSSHVIGICIKIMRLIKKLSLLIYV